MQQAVQGHYNDRKRYSKNEACFTGRSITNAVKNACIQNHVKCTDAITLFGGGHGAQVGFLESVVRVKQLHLYDLSEDALKSAAERAGCLPCTLHPCDFTQPLPADQTHVKTQLVEAGLCLHYAATSEQNWVQALQNAKQLMQKDGRLIVTIPHAEHIIFMFRVQWVRVHCGCAWQQAYDALITHNDDCSAAMRALGGSPAETLQQCGVPDDVAQGLASDDPDFELLRQRACGVVHVDNVFTILADWVVSWECPPTLGEHEWGKMYYFRLHAKTTSNSYCPEPLIPSAAWSIVADMGFRQHEPRQTLMQWLWDRRHSCSPALFKALGRTRVDATVDLYLHTYCVTVLHLYDVPQRVPPPLSLTSYLFQCGRTPCAQDGSIRFEPPLQPAVDDRMRWDRVLGWVQEDEMEEDDPQPQFTLTEEALKELARRRL